METQKNPKFFCEKCQFITNNKKDFARHEMTRKHKNGVIGNIRKQKKPLICIGCKKSYNSRSGLYKHHKSCEKYIDYVSSQKTSTECSTSDDNASENNSSIHIEIMDVENKSTVAKKRSKTRRLPSMENEQQEKNPTQEMYNLLLKYCKTVDELIPKLSTVTHHTTNNITNNTTNNINLHVYLNEQCKDAFNLPEFIENIKLQISDLSLANKDGLLHSTKNIFLKELQNTEPVKRPIQCTDIKRKTLYIKEDGSWCKDVGNEKVKDAIHNLSQKHMPLIKDLKNEENNVEYLQAVKSAAQNVLEEERGVQSALREICKETYMKGVSTEQ